jgi:hypothetical protein
MPCHAHVDHAAAQVGECAEAGVCLTIKGLEVAPRKVLDAAAALPDESARFGALPPALVAKLMPYQVDGIKFALRCGGRCLYGDEMGLGKTVQVRDTGTRLFGR